MKVIITDIERKVVRLSYSQVADIVAGALSLDTRKITFSVGQEEFFLYEETSKPREVDLDK